MHEKARSETRGLDNGFGRLQNDAGRLDDGLKSLPNGPGMLEHGLGSLEKGPGRLDDGLERLENGSKRLHGKMALGGWKCRLRCWKIVFGGGAIDQLAGNLHFSLVLWVSGPVHPAS